MRTTSKIVRAGGPMLGLLLAFLMGQAVETYRHESGGNCFAQDIEWQRVGKSEFRAVESIKEGYMDRGVCIVGTLSESDES